jgi:hypothetical protein
MALLATLLGLKEIKVAEEDALPQVEYPVYNRASGLRCPNSKCVSIQDAEMKYLKPEFKIVNTEPLTLRCVYCEHGIEPGFVASADWHEGKLETKKYHSADSHWARTIRSENLIVFNTEEEAQAHGFKPSHYTGDHH